MDKFILFDCARRLQRVQSSDPRPSTGVTSTGGGPGGSAPPPLQPRPRRCPWRRCRPSGTAAAAGLSRSPSPCDPAGPHRNGPGWRARVSRRTQHGQSPLLRWFPAAKLREVPMFSLEPFEWPAVPARGTYAVAYMNRRCEPIGLPRFSIAIDQADSRLHHSDGDRTYKPRPRG